MRKLLVIIVILAIAGWFIVPRFMGGAPGPGGMMPGGAMPVTVAEAIQRDVVEWDEFSGRLKAVEDVQIRPRVAGMIEAVHFSDGASVNKDDVLFTIDPKPYEAEVQAARARATLAEAELTRATALLKEKALAQKDLDQRKNAAEVARADLKMAQLRLGYTKVRAPVAGKVGRVEVTAGNLVDVGMPVLTTIVSQDPIYVDFEVDEKRFLSYLSAAGNNSTQLSQVPVQLGLSGEEGTPHEGHVHSFDNQLNTASGTIRVRAVFENTEGRLVPGLFARVRLGGVKHPAVLISDRAINTDQSKKFVYVVSADGKTEYREIKLGPVTDGMRVVRDGLKAGEPIIVSVSRFLMPGMPVSPSKIPMEDADKPAPPPAPPGAEAAPAAGAETPAAAPAEGKAAE